MAIVPLNGENYPTWKIQCQMSLMKEGVWGFATGAEAVPDTEERRVPYLAKRDKALAIIVLAVDPSLLYLLGDPVDPKVVWEALSGQFQKKSWANKLELKRKLFSMKMNNGGAVQAHIKAMTEILDELSVVDEPVKEEDRVVYLLASLPEAYSMLVTALEANAEVPKLTVVIERLLHEEKKQKARISNDQCAGEEEAFATRYSRPQFSNKGPKCYGCGKMGHIKRNCTESGERPRGAPQDRRRGAYHADAVRRDEDDEEGVGLFVGHALAAQASSQGKWIMDSGATSHMCCNKRLFKEFHALDHELEVTLGDGHALQATGRGKVMLPPLLFHTSSRSDHYDRPGPYYMRPII